MLLVEFGLSLYDIELLYQEYDNRILLGIIRRVSQLLQRRKLEYKLSIAEAFNFAYIGSKPSKYKRNQSAYSRWQRNILYKISKLDGKKLPTLWDVKRRKIRKKSRSIKF